MSNPICTIDGSGIHKPSYSDVHQYFIEKYRAIYGADIYIEPDSQDGQMLAIFSAAVDDANSMALAVYNSFRPDYAQGAGLSAVVKINGLSRKVASYSTVDVRLIGQAGTVINNGAVRDQAAYQWLLPARVVIPLSGEITVTATCATLGAIAAPSNSVTQIATPTLGWQSVTNPTAAERGDPVESDPELRARQRISCALPSLSILDGLHGALAAAPGVGQIRIYENDRWGVDAWGIPGHSLAVVISGGSAATIANIIRLKKGAGVSTFGAINFPTLDAAGVEKQIWFSRPASVPISWYVTLTANAGYTREIQQRIADELVNWTNGLGIGNPVVLPQAMLPIQLYGDPAQHTFRITSVSVARDGVQPGTVDIPLAYNEIAMTSPDYILFTVR